MAAPAMLTLLRRRVFNYFRGAVAAFDVPTYPEQNYGPIPAFANDVESTADGMSVSNSDSSSFKSILNDIIGNGLLWAVQTKRRSLERRHTRLRCDSKTLKTRKNLAMCVRCGNFHEVHTICGHCYDKIREETKAIQEAIAKEWNSHAVDKEVSVVYEGEDRESSDTFYKGQRIVEMKKVRPHWFHPNLTVKTRPPPSDGGLVSRSSTSIVPRIKN